MTEPSQYFKGRTVQEQMNEVIGYVDTRAAEVATAAIASDVAQVHQDMLDADADATAAAASAAAAAGTLANAVKKTGEASQSIEGDVLLTTGDLGVAGDLGVTGNLGVTGSATVPTPVNNTDAATKKYVDDADALDVKLAGAQTITGPKNVPLEATGTYSNQIASSQKVRNEIDNYCLKLTDNQVFSGIKRTNTGAFIAGASGEDRRFVYIDSNLDTTSPPGSNTGTGKFCWRDKNDILLGDIGLVFLANGTTSIFARVRNSDGTIKNVTLAMGDVI